MKYKKKLYFNKVYYKILSTIMCNIVGMGEPIYKLILYVYML